MLGRANLAPDEAPPNNYIVEYIQQHLQKQLQQQLQQQHLSLNKIIFWPSTKKVCLVLSLHDPAYINKRNIAI